MRVHASWVRLFVDGEEMPVRVVNEGAMIQSVKDTKPSAVRFRVGLDNQPTPVRYEGRIEGIQLLNDAQTSEGLRAQYEATAGPETDAGMRAARAQLRAARQDWLALRRTVPTVMVMDEMATPRETHVLQRGSYNAPGEVVQPGVPEALLGAWPKGAPANRLGLAKWLTGPDHPLTARVVVNRFWQQLFGLGLVKSSDNFGLQGDWPSHPELLDWLAREFVESGWNVKALLRQMVLSDTYRQDSSATPEMAGRDPENRLLARGPRFRLPAELIRDQALAVSGLLRQRVGGPGVFPYQPEGLYKGIVVAADYPATKWVESSGDDLYRRSLYTFWKRTVPHPTFTVLDAPDREVCIVRRPVTNTPLQALTLLNDPIFLEAARKLAERAIREGGSDPASRLTYAFRLVTGRAPERREVAVLRKKLDEMLASYANDASGAESFVSAGKSPRDTAIAVTELAAWTAVANLLLNLDETVTKG
jgi:hypothetical protein